MIIDREPAAVLLVEDVLETRQALADAIVGDDRLELLAAVGTVAEARAELKRGPRVVLVDLGLPDGSGTEIIAEAATLDPAPEIMVITVFADDRYVLRAIEAGAAGYLLKDAAPEAVADAIHQLLDGGSPITPAIARQLLKRFSAGAPSADALRASPRPSDEACGLLTAREQEVLALVARGYSNNEIAGLLEVSFHTITSHVKHIYRKLSVRSRSEAVFEATRIGIIRPPTP